jgi:hypothetical protein
MNRIRTLIIFTILSVFGFSGIFLSSCKKKLSEGMIVFTQVSRKVEDINLTNQESTGKKILAQIVALKPNTSDSQPSVLTKEFYSARSPEIACDGYRMLFSAQKKQGDRWQIWEMDLSNYKPRQVLSLSENCYDPAFLPNGRILFSRESVGGDLNSGLAIFSCKSDGSDLRQVTFNPYSYSASSVLSDGRVLVICRPLDSIPDDAEFMVLRPDGTKNELFYKASPGKHPGSRGRETATGSIVFVEADKSKSDGGELISINYNRPMHTFINLSSETDGSFSSVFPLKSGKLMVCYRKSDSDMYGLYEFDPENKTMGKTVYESKDYDIAEVVAVEKHERSRKLPSEVDMGVKTGLILCQNVNFQDPGASKIAGVTKIRVIGKDSTLGEINVEKDGSFYLKVIADTPFQIQTIDDKGNVTGNPCGWVYLRPNERRGCIGCHENQELVPENKVPLAVKNAPVNIPVHISKVVEKKVSLE